MTATPTTAPREVLERASIIFGNDRSLHWDRAVELAAEQIEAEQAIDAERQAKSKAFTDSIAAFWSCGCCGGNAGPGARDALCERCRFVVNVVRAERLGADVIGKHTRREMASAYLDNRPG
jgi:hypothetical protein